MSRFDGNIIIGTSVDVGGIGTGLNKITNSFNKLSRTIQNNMLTKVFSNAASAASDLIEVQNIVDVTFEDMSWKAERFGNIAVEKFGMSELTAKQTAGSFMAMGKAMDLGAENASNMAIALAGLTGDFASFYNISQEYARVALSAVYTGETETLKRYGIILTEANLQQFANTKGIKENVKLMDAREKAILRYQYVMEQASFIQGDFERTQGSFANQTRLLGQVWNEFLIVLGQGVTTVLIPLIQVLNQVIVKLKQFTGVVLVILGNIFGIDFSQQQQSVAGIADGIEEAAEAEDELADATGRATKAAWKALQPFDELNVIRTPSSGGGGKGGGADIFGDWEAEIPFYLPDKLKEVFDSSIDNLYDFGRWLSQGLIDILDSIDWDLIYDKARKIGKGFAEFLNGLFNPEMFYKIARTIANGFNTIIYNIQAFAEEFDWEQFGEAIGEGINGFFENFDWEAAGDTLQVIVDGVEKTAKKVIETVNWKEIGKSLKTLFSKIPWEVYLAVGVVAVSRLLTKLMKKVMLPLLVASLRTIIGDGFTSAFKAIPGIFKVQLPALFSSIGTFLSDALSTFWTLNTVDLSTIILSETSPAVIGATIAMGIIEGLIAAFAGYHLGKGVLGPLLMPEDKDWYKEFSFFGDDGFFDTIISNFSSLGDAINGLFTDLDGIGAYLFPLQSLTENIKNFFDALVKGDEEAAKESAFGILLASVNSLLGPLGSLAEFKLSELIPEEGREKFISFFTEITDGIVPETWETVKNFFSGLWEDFLTFLWNPLVDKISNLWSNISTALSPVTNFVKHIMEGIKILVEAGINIMHDKIQEIITKIKFKIAEIKTEVYKVRDAIYQKVTEISDKISTFITEKWTQITTFLTNLWAKFTEFVKGLWNDFITYVYDPVMTKIAEFVVWIGDKAKEVWNKIKDNVITPIKDVILSAVTYINDNFIQPFVDKLTTALNDLKEKFSELWENAKEGGKGFANGVIGFIESMINGIINAFNNGLLSWFNKVVTAASKITKESWTPIDSVGNISIPRLATGAVIPPNAPFLAMLGDQKSGTNIEAPLDTIKQALAEVLGSGNGGEGEIHIHVDVDGREIAKTMVKQNNIYRNRTGRSLLV